MVSESLVKSKASQPMEKQPPTLLGRTREVLRLKHYSPKTEESYLHWIKRLIRFYKPHGKGEQDRVTMLPDTLITPLQTHLQWRKQMHERI